MSKKTKLVVLKSREIIYGLIFFLVFAALITLIFYMFSPNDNSAMPTFNTIADEQSDKLEAAAEPYSFISSIAPGIYDSTLTLGSNTFPFTVTCSAGNIEAITLTDTDDSIISLYPLLPDAVAYINSNLPLNEAELEELAFPDDLKYTCILITDALINAISN